MVERRAEDEGLGTCLRGPAEDQAGDRLIRDLHDGAANDQTHLLEGGDVGLGTYEPPGPAEPADTGTAGVAARLGQPQSQRLISDPHLVGNLVPCREGHRRPMRGRSRLQRVSW